MLRCGEVPVGAIVVLDGEIIGEGTNLRETGRSAAHAEVVAMHKLLKRLVTGVNRHHAMHHS